MFIKYQYYQLQNNIACLTFSLARSKLVTHQRREQDDNNHTDLEQCTSFNGGANNHTDLEQCTSFNGGVNNHTYLEQCTSFNGGVNLSIARALVSKVVNGINVNCGNLDVY